MTEEDLYDNVVASLIRRVQDFREAYMPEAEYVNWDAHAQISELPPKDLIGLAGVGLAEDEPKKYQLVFGIAISTWDDPNLSRLTKLISRLRGQLKPETKIVVYDHETAEPNSWIVTTTPQAVTPVSRAEVRAVQALELHALLNPASASSLR